jgi:hypothetical protein
LTPKNLEAAPEHSRSRDDAIGRQDEAFTREEVRVGTGGTFLCLHSSQAMKSTERKASAGMIRFALIILGLAVIFAAVYLFFLTPAEPENGQTPPHAINQGTP